MNHILNYNFRLCDKAEILYLTVCIVVNGEKFHEETHILTLMFPCYFHILQYFQVSNLLINYFLRYKVSHTHTHTHTHTQIPRCG